MATTSLQLLPNNLYLAEQVREIDQAIMGTEPVSAFDLMLRAAQAAFGLLVEYWPQAKHICVLAGSGNNGGDAWLVAALAKKHGLEVQLYDLAKEGLRTSEGQQAQAYAVEAGVQAQPFMGALEAHTDLIVDGLLGIGLQGEVNAHYQAAIHSINSHPASVFSLDIPSGLHADTGAVLGAAVQADITLTFVALKQGLFTAHGPDMTGQIFYAPLTNANVKELAVASAQRIYYQHLSQQELLPSRAKNSHKGMFGHVLVAGGESGYGGAVILAAEAAARTGAGLVSCATHPEHLTPLLSRCPNIMAKAVGSGLELQPLIEQASVLAIGPGLGQQGWAELFMQQALLTNKPIVLDADALNLLAKPQWQTQFEGRLVVLTPHPGEAARLLGVSIEEIQADRFSAASSLANQYSATVVLKGQGSIVANPNGRVAVCTEGNSGMSSGGMGDVLTGVIAALMAQGLSAWDASCLGVCLHAKAADECAQHQGAVGMLAQDLMPYLQKLINV